MRTMWNGTLQLGELAIPVGLAATVRDGDEHFRKLHASCRSPIKLRGYCEPDEQLLDETDMLSAYEVAPGEFIVLDDQERAALEPEESRLMRINGFINAADLDPFLERKRYHLVPSKTVVGRRGYALLAGAVQIADVVGLVRFVAWKSEQLGAVSSRDGYVLELTTLRFAEDVIEAGEISDEIAEIADDLNADLRELAQELVERHTRPVRPDDFVSVERPRVRELLDAKLAGNEIVRPAAADENERAAPATADLGAALKRSVKAAPRRRRAPAAR